MIKTTNLHLIICEPVHIQAFLRGKSELAALLGVTIPDSWPTFPEAFPCPLNPIQPQMNGVVTCSSTRSRKRWSVTAAL